MLEVDVEDDNFSYFWIYSSCMMITTQPGFLTTVSSLHKSFYPITLHKTDIPKNVTRERMLYRTVLKLSVSFLSVCFYCYTGH